PPSYGIGTTAIGRAEALPPMMSISRPCCWATARPGTSRQASRKNQRNEGFMGRGTGIRRIGRDTSEDVNIFPIMNEKRVNASPAVGAGAPAGRAVAPGTRVAVGTAREDRGDSWKFPPGRRWDISG